jgi:hypothetical protein
VLLFPLVKHIRSSEQLLTRPLNSNEDAGRILSVPVPPIINYEEIKKCSQYYFFNHQQ